MTKAALLANAKQKDGIEPLVIKHDRSTVKADGSQSQAYKFFSTYHLDYKPRIESEIYTTIEPSTINFPEGAIICKFKDGRYRIFYNGTVWSSLRVAMKELNIAPLEPVIDPNTPQPEPLPVIENRACSKKTAEFFQNTQFRVNLKTGSNGRKSNTKYIEVDAQQYGLPKDAIVWRYRLGNGVLANYYIYHQGIVWSR
jgi:hypothetical protein